MSDQQEGLPKMVGDGLLLRWGTKADLEETAAFNLRIHSDNLAEPDQFLSDWTKLLMQGGHPTTNASDFTVVVDQNDGDKIVSSCCLISQTWLYDDVPFGVGRPELVGTDEAYRRRGLVREQFAALHAKSAARGELAQAITGIPYYYRQFEYEMTVVLGGGRAFPFVVRQAPKEPPESDYVLRAAEPDDIPLLMRLYDTQSSHTLLRRKRTAEDWRYELFEADRKVFMLFRNVHMIQHKTAGDVGYVEFQHFPGNLTVREMAVLPTHSLRAVALDLLEKLRRLAEEKNEAGKPPARGIGFAFGQAHPLYDALDLELKPVSRSYAYYMRVPDLAEFLQHIAPVLDRRLANSVLAGSSREIKLNFYRTQLQLRFEAGKLTAVSPYTPKNQNDGNAFFPDLTFLHLLFGHRTLEELKHSYADVSTRDVETIYWLNALFPKKPTDIIPLS